MKQCRTDCIHAEACRRYADNSTYWQNGDCPIYKPASDVVPKSSIEMSEYLLKGAHKRIEELDKLCGDLQKVKSELPKEIFEEIDAYMRIDSIDERFPFLAINPDKYAELKKKYTKSEGKG